MAKKKQPPPAAPGIRDRIKDFRRVPARELAGAPWNWRIHPEAQRRAVVGSIEELGFFSPLDTRELPDGTLELIDGHLRQEIINADIGPDTLIPVVVTDFTEAEAKKANLLKDPLAAMAEADKGALDALLRDVQFQSPDLTDLMGHLSNDVPAVPEEPAAVKPLSIPREPPKMTWVLVGIDTVRFGEINEAVEKIAAVPGVVMETTSNEHSLGSAG